MKAKKRIRPISRVNGDELKRHGANFTLEGLRFHYRKLEEYTNLKGGGLDKIPLNTIAHEQLHRQQFSQPEENARPATELLGYEHIPPSKPIFLRKKALYQVANHLLGIGPVAYWTGSRGRSTLLGLDVDDHESNNPEIVIRNCLQALELFTNLTGWSPVACPSGRGIHGFLILDKGWLTAQATNEIWHGIVRNVQAEASRRNMPAKLECKGKARVINEKMSYGGVLLKDPFTGMNPTDAEIRAFWDVLEKRKISDQQLRDALSTLENRNSDIPSMDKIQPLPEMQNEPSDSNKSTTDSSDQGSWVKNCRDWAIHGLNTHDSMAEVVLELSKWLYFIELFELAENDRFTKVVEILQYFCLNKNNGFITRLTANRESDVLNHIERIVQSMIQRSTESAKTCFSRIRNKRNSGQYHDLWFIEQLIYSSNPPSSSVKLIKCCSVSPKRKNPKEWDYVPDMSPLPKALDEMIRKNLEAKGAKGKTYQKIVGLLNHIKSRDGEARLGIESLKKMGFSDHRSRQHILMLRQLGLLIEKGYSPVIGLGKLFVLTTNAREAFGMPVFDPEDFGQNGV